MKKNSRKQFTSVDHSVCSKIFDALHNPRAFIARRAITPEPHSTVWTKSEQLRRKLASFELGSPRVSTNMVAKTRRDSTETADSSSVTNSPGSFCKIPRTSTAYRKYGTRELFSPWPVSSDLQLCIIFSQYLLQCGPRSHVRLIS
ncbi:hypothetical protein FGIG_06269 [Fasciola gigantica]|uniref:Uncharacterized protein n=1 Tax=Fasciola gigantica TaxID=46835 RepID=A0A504Y5W1_FASGI|nr:hypothetical protein FGIG_06269 [Fasciola gigantica]